MADNNKILDKKELKSIVSKRKKKKIIIVSCISAAVLVLAAIIGVIAWNIFGITPIKRTAEQGRVVGNIGEYKVYQDEFSYLVGIHKKDLEYKYGNINWDGGSDFAQSCIDEVEQKVSADIKKNYSILMLCEQNGIDTNSREINKAVNDKVKEYIDAGFRIGDSTELKTGKSAYKKWLAENDLSDAFFRLTIKTNLLEEKLVEKLADEGKEIEYNLESFPDFTKFAAEEDELLRTTHVYFPKHYEYKNVDVQYEKNRAQTMIDAMRAESSATKRYEMINDYINNGYLVEGYSMMDKNGLYIFDGMMPEAYYDTAKELSNYGVGDLVETEDGFYVIMRLPKDDSFIDKNGESLLQNYQWAKVSVLKRELEKTISFECEDFSALVLGELTK